jgi:AcrR family transcriptional regulator
VTLPRTRTRAPSLREEHKQATARALREAALKLFAARGYDTTTTEEVADKAGVSARTFFRYFPTKESVLFLHERDWLHSLLDSFAEQPDSLSDVDAICAALTGLAPELARRRPYLLLYERVVASSPTLRGRVHDRTQEEIADLAQAIAARRGRAKADEECGLLAAIGLLTHRRALAAWLNGPAAADLGHGISQEFKLLAQLLKTDQRARNRDRTRLPTRRHAGTRRRSG